MTTRSFLFWLGILTKDVHHGETVVEGHSHQESSEGEEDETLRISRDDTGRGPNQIAQNQRRNTTEPVGQVTK